MRSILLCAVGALTLAACQQPATPAEEAPAAADAGADASAMAPASPDRAAPATGATGSGNGAAASGDASADTMGSAPANDGGIMSGPSPETRDMAKEKAEETNLHPRTP